LISLSNKKNIDLALRRPQDICINS